MDAKGLVYSVMHQLLPETTIKDDTKLADIGYDSPPTKDIIRAVINSRHWLGVNLPFLALNDCSTIADVTKVVAAAEHH